MREIDRVTTEKFGVPSLTLMENAGTAVAEHVLRFWQQGLRMLVICGKGNNGGDGFVVARLLAEREKLVKVVLLADPAELKGDAAVMYGKLPESPTVVRSLEEWKSERVQQVLSADLYVDAILGTGFKPPVSGLYAESDFILEYKPGKGDCRRHPFGCRCGRDGSTAGSHRAIGCDGDVHGSPSGACVQHADAGSDVCCGNRVAGGGDRLIAA